MPLEKAIAQAIFKKMAGKNLSGGALIRMAQKAGATYRRQEMLNDIRKYEGYVKYQGRIRNLPFDAKVPKAWMVETELGVDARYRVFGEATFYDEEADDYFQQTVSFYTDDWEEGGEYGMAFGDSFGANYLEEGMEFIEFNQAGLEHNEKWDY